MTTSTRRNFPIIACSINNNVKSLDNLKQRFKRTISWNKYRSKITTQPKNNSLVYMIDPTFRKSQLMIMILQEILLLSILCYYAVGNKIIYITKKVLISIKKY